MSDPKSTARRAAQAQIIDADDAPMAPVVVEIAVEQRSDQRNRRHQRRQPTDGDQLRPQQRLGHRHRQRPGRRDSRRASTNRSRSPSGGAEGDRAYVSTVSPAYDSIAVIDMSTDTVVATHPLALSVSDLAVSADGKHVYASRNGARRSLTWRSWTPRRSASK